MRGIVSRRPDARRPAPWPVAFAFLVLCWSTTGCSRDDQEQAAGADPPPASPSQPADSATIEVACPNGTLPVDIGPTQPPKIATFVPGSSTLNQIQCGFDVFSWNSFLALNHAPDGSFGNKSGDNYTVWESWPEASDIFLPGGVAPPAWPDQEPPPPREIPAACSGVSSAAASSSGGYKVLSQVGKRPDILSSSSEPFNSGPLIDVNGWYSRFEITVNQDMYQYILGNTLYSREGQATFAATGTVSFPCGCEGVAPAGPGGEAPPPAPNPTAHACVQGGQEGAIMVKASWKVLDPQVDDASTFHTAEALVVTPATDQQPESCETLTMGLVGLHIGHKTQPQPQWIWSTFEHVRNAPDLDAEPSAGEKFNYYQADCDDCNAVNQPPPQPWNPHDEPVSGNGGKSQVKRGIAITPATVEMNGTVQAALTGTVWQNYQLVSTQWPTDASGTDPGTPSADNGWCDALDPTDKSGVPAPTFLANTTLETYIQGTVPQASSSCINCHLNATMTEGVNNFSDFTYLLERAQGETD